MAIVAIIKVDEERHRAGSCDNEADVMVVLERDSYTTSREGKKEEQSPFVLFERHFFRI